MTATPPAAPQAAKHPWAGGVTVFAGVMLMIAGMLSIFRGVMGIAQDDVFVATRSYAFQFDLTGWGWVHLVLGAVAVLVSMGIFQGARWARIGGVVVAAFVIIAGFLSLPYSPVWSVVLIAFSGLVVWALCVLAREDVYRSGGPGLR
ncbi:DUF7144 family membrane protein [Streptomyces tropicalis]|uniref:DUF7144 domain-containing protein n=1 Tax=Streptomyces tropicalis TaxID=3034234 RepID=A0ABT6A4E0_9ACTN|nr:hypothetical protein [Streptomyces tropicalis]MDF3299509.1 hypothetical protein [Streptomyces tropicalis]